MHKTMKNGGLIKNNRKNEPIKLPIFGAHQFHEGNFIFFIYPLFV